MTYGDHTHTISHDHTHTFYSPRTTLGPPPGSYIRHDEPFMDPRTAPDGEFTLYAMAAQAAKSALNKETPMNAADRIAQTRREKRELEKAEARYSSFDSQPIEDYLGLVLTWSSGDDYYAAVRGGNGWTVTGQTGTTDTDGLVDHLVKAGFDRTQVNVR